MCVLWREKTLGLLPFHRVIGRKLGLEKTLLVQRRNNIIGVGLLDYAGQAVAKLYSKGLKQYLLNDEKSGCLWKYMMYVNTIYWHSTKLKPVSSVYVLCLYYMSVNNVGQTLIIPLSCIITEAITFYEQVRRKHVERKHQFNTYIIPWFIIA